MPSYFSYHQPEGPVGVACKAAGFSNSIVLPKNARTVITAGQAGMDLSTGTVVTTSVADQIDAAFTCLEAALLAAGVTDGLKAVYKVVSYFADCRYEPLMMEIWRKRVPDNWPTWTCIGSSGFCVQGMVCELQCEAVLVEE